MVREISYSSNKVSANISKKIRHNSIKNRQICSQEFFLFYFIASIDSYRCKYIAKIL